MSVIWCFGCSEASTSRSVTGKLRLLLTSVHTFDFG